MFGVMVASTGHQHLTDLRNELVGMSNSSEWAPVKLWITRAKPVIKKFFVDHVADFNEITTEPEWVQSPFSISSDRYDRRDTSSNADRALRNDRRINTKLITDAIQNILGFVDTLLRMNVDEVDHLKLEHNRTNTTGIRIFISHSAKDVALATALVHCLEASLELPDGVLRCTSVHGYKLDPGDNADTSLRQSIEDCFVVVGLITPSSIQSGYVVMELGAAWGLRKKTYPVLGNGADFKSLCANIA